MATDEKSIAQTRVAMAQVMLPQDANPAGNIHGGVIMKLIDTAAAVVASRHAQCNTVTASIDSMSFHNPVYIGDLLILKAGINMVGRSSMEIGVRVEAEDYIRGIVRHTASAYLTFVALDEDGDPATVPGLRLESDDDRRRNREAEQRRNARLALRRSEAASQRQGRAQASTEKP